MKKPTLLICFLFICLAASAQKYTLIDETMVLPVQFKDEVTLKDTYRHIFVVETAMLRKFITNLVKISNQIIDKKDHPSNMAIGNTFFLCRNMVIANESRFDLILNTHCKEVNVSMHLLDAKYSNAQNYYFISLWIKYISSYLQ